MTTNKTFFCLSLFLLIPAFGTGQSTPPKPTVNAYVIPLTVQSGVPIRVSLEKTVRIKHVGAPVEGRVLDPIYVFDREVIPAGSTLLGSVTRIDPISKGRRLEALANGNFTPFHEAHIEFRTLVLKDGKRFSIQTQVSPGTSNTIQLVAGGKDKKDGRIHGKIAEIRRQVEQSKKQAIEAIEAPHKLKRVEAMLSAQLPFHRQFLPAGTQFTATFRNPLALGTEEVSPQELKKMGSKIPPSSTVHVWLATTLSSAKDHKGSPVEAVVARPLFSKDHKLILPQGARLEGSVTKAVPARRLNRNGKLRFTFQRIELPHGTVQKVEAGLQAATVAKSSHLEIDSEGGARTVSSKKKYIMPAIAVLLATSSFDGDSQQRLAQERGTFQPGDLTGGAARGGIGFGLMGSVLALAARAQPLTAALAFYGAAMSVYSHILARGSEVVFPKDTPMQIRFGTHDSAGPRLKGSPAPKGKLSKKAI